MRLGIRAKQIAGVTAIVGLAVVALSIVNVVRVTDVVLHASSARGELLASALSHRARAIIVNSPDRMLAVRTDPAVVGILQSALYDESVTRAAIVDPKGVAIAHWDPTQVGRSLPQSLDLGQVAAASPFEKLRVIYSRDGNTLEVRRPLLADDPQFATILIGVSTLLMRRELNTALTPTLYTAAGALLIGVFVAALLAQLLLRPIHVIRSGLTRLGKGEFGVTLDLPPGDEFGELGSFFNTVSQQLSADRTLLAGQKANLQSAVENLEDAVALFNPSGELLFANPAMQPALPPDCIGRALQALLPAGHPYRRLVEETLATRTARGPVQGDENQLLMTHAVSGTDGGLVGVLLVSRNLAYLSQMQSTIAYSRKLVALGRLTAGIAHEVKNPLNAMMIHLELLRTKLRSAAREAVAAGPVALVPDTPRVKGTTDPIEHVEIIETEIRRLDEVVQGFLKFTRPEDLRLQPVRVTTLFDEMLPVIEPEARAADVRVQVDCPVTATAVNGDAAMLRQAFLNLAMNAIQAMPHGGTLRLACGAGKSGRVEVRFEDTGVGILPEHLGRIFDLYFTTKERGTGIGLSMVFRIVQMHDGEVEVQSTPGRGTAFRVLLPQANEV